MLTKITVLLLWTTLLIAGCNSKQESTPQPANRAALQKVTISYGGPLPSLLAIAADQDFFTREGLDVTIKDCILGKSALEEMLAGKSDYAVHAETPLVVKSFARNDFLIIASLGTTDNLNSIVTRGDRGIKSVVDLKGRRVATAQGTLPHYFLDLLLAKNGLNEKDIVPLFMGPDKLESALLDGRVDAISTTTNNSRKALIKLGNKGGLIEESGLCLANSIFTTSKKNISANPDQVGKILRALRAAERFLQQNPGKSREIVMTSLNLSQMDYNTVWAKYTDRLALDEVLLLMLEEQAAWVMQKGTVAQQQIPNYLDFIDAGHLQKAAPEAVRLKR
ncbi:MAG: ABC transporter substrate-binding protein [Desulfuromonadales bacterium]